MYVPHKHHQKKQKWKQFFWNKLLLSQ